MPASEKILEGMGPVRITDTTFRDGHQSTLATRFRTEDMLPIAEKMDEVGFHSRDEIQSLADSDQIRFRVGNPFEGDPVGFRYLIVDAVETFEQGNHLRLALGRRAPLDGEDGDSGLVQAVRESLDPDIDHQRLATEKLLDPVH